MHGSQNCSPTNAPKCSRKWNYRKTGMAKHKKAKKERRCINKDLHAIKTEAMDLSSNVCEAHLEAYANASDFEFLNTSDEIFVNIETDSKLCEYTVNQEFL